MNHVTLIGRLGNDPEVKSGASGTTYCRFLLATNEGWRAKGEKHERTDWHRVVAFGKRAEALEPLRKGDKVAVRGQLRGEFKDLGDGKSRLEVEVHAAEIEFLYVKAWSHESRD